MTAARLDVAPCPYDAARALERALGVSPTLAQVLVRRGFAAPDAARAFLAADEEHPPEAFAGIEAALSVVAGHVSAGTRITIHGDYDVDGVCSTAILVRALRGLGADVDWYLPDRAGDGYGLAAPTVERLARRGTRLLLTADCAITAVDEVAAARAAGLDVVVTDHHAPRADGRLPDAPIVHPAVSRYPDPNLCATGVAYQLARALYRRAGADEAPVVADLDLVALATIADVVPLLGENRTLVRRGLRALATTAKPGLRALMAVARVNPARVDARAAAFGLCPRINVAGRLQRADAALELILTEDPARAAEVADELDRANHQRRALETRVLFEAEALIAQRGERAAYALAGEGWHPGVIGIVASRLAERHHRPVVLVALDEDGDGGRGSGRSIEGFDLLGALRACARALERYGGHRAAAGLQIRRERVDDFAAAFTAHAERVLEPAQLHPRQRVDAVVAGDELGLELAEELERLAPFGAGNPDVALLLPAATLCDAAPMGEGRHVRFAVRAGGARSLAVGFGTGGRLPVESDRPADAVFSLEVNDYRGAVEPRLVLRRAQTSAPGPIRLLAGDGLAAAWAEYAAGPATSDAAPASGREVRDRRGRGVAGTLGSLVASGEGVLVVCADARRRAAHLDGRLGGFAICSYRELERTPGLADPFHHVALLDPPAWAAAHALARAGRPEAHAHLLWGEDERRFAERVHERDHDLRAAIAAGYRALRAAGGPVRGTGLTELLDGLGPPIVAGRVLRVLDELELVEVDVAAGAVGLVAARATELERSPTFAACARRLLEGRTLLGSVVPAAA